MEYKSGKKETHKPSLVWDAFVKHYNASVHSAPLLIKTLEEAYELIWSDKGDKEK